MFPSGSLYFLFFFDPFAGKDAEFELDLFGRRNKEKIEFVMECRRSSASGGTEAKVLFVLAWRFDRKVKHDN